jgi:hypothetical protein
MGGAPGTGGDLGLGGDGVTGNGGAVGSGGVAGNNIITGLGGGGGVVTTATGVETLTVGLTANGQGQRYNAQNRSSPSAPYDLSGQTLTVRVYAPGAIGGDLSIFFRSTSVADSPATLVALSAVTAGFSDLVIPVPAATGGFDPTLVDDIRIEVEAGGQFGSTFQSPATIVYIDSITSSNGAVALTFDTTPAQLDFATSGVRQVTGASASWTASVP